MANPSTDLVYQLHIQLAYIEPPIWRRIVVSGQIKLFALDRMLQVVMGWENSHLHQFIVDKTYYGEPDPEYGDRMKDERRVRLQAIAREVGASFIYEYDFGDGWRHVITVEDISPLNEYMIVPRCLDGARACPPEDCGGIGDYAHLLAVLPKIAEALATMHICLKRCGIDVIPSTRSCVHGWESTMIRSCFRCRRSIQPWPFLDRAFLPLLYVSFI